MLSAVRKVDFDPSRVSSRSLRRVSGRMLFHRVRLEVDFVLEYDKLLSEAVWMRAQEMGRTKVLLETLVVEVVLVTDPLTNADEAFFMRRLAMFLEGVKVVERDFAEFARRVIGRHVFLQLFRRIRRMLVRKDLFERAAQVAKVDSVLSVDVLLEVPPSETNGIASRLRAVEP